jgi:CDP-diacylglycerol--serine O-phosphatidyltransferase
MLVCCYLLISEIPMFSFKIKPGHMGLKENLVRYSFLVITIVLLVVFGIFHAIQASLALIILLYILFSLFSRSKA